MLPHVTQQQFITVCKNYFLNNVNLYLCNFSSKNYKVLSNIKGKQNDFQNSRGEVKACV